MFCNLVISRQEKNAKIYEFEVVSDSSGSSPGKFSMLSLGAESKKYTRERKVDWGKLVSSVVQEQDNK